jgi:formylglycine-generating enzyme required for sulfatase activity
MSLAPDWWRRTGYRLPTEAEWVYACRAGAETDFYFGKSFDLVKHYVWNAANSTGRSHPVGAKKPNDFGLFDMHGNVWEWSQDACGDNGEPMDDKEAPAIIDNDRRRVLLGAGWGNQTTDLRPAFHIWNAPTHKSPAVGFRPVRVLAEAN